MCLRGELEVRSKYNGVNRAGLLAETTVDALGHVDIVTGGSAGTVGTGLGFDRDGKSRADGLTELAGNAALFTRGITTKGVLTTETRRDGALLEGVVEGNLGEEDLLHKKHHTTHHLGQEGILGETLDLVSQRSSFPVRSLDGSCSGERVKEEAEE